METVLEAINVMGCASSIEIAARLGLERQRVVDELWELKRNGQVRQNGRAWASLNYPASNANSADADAAPVSAGAEPPLCKLTLEEFVEKIPSFTTSASGGVLTKLKRQLSQARRRNRAEATRLDEITEAVRVLSKPGNRGLVEELMQWQDW
ncbi:hypothetical protein [Cronobacter dublinensis]|uniref:hypothetical protein n=1 Tax=Cronobacter dublinensis TaxID=413497 RepID=UPI00300E6387